PHHQEGLHHQGKDPCVKGKAALKRARAKEKAGRPTNIGDPSSKTCQARFPDLYNRYHSREF
ncbi:MAG: hypothetical protein ACXABY_32660, partial [Candidatus Thorarchaeota archaeon]